MRHVLLDTKVPLTAIELLEIANGSRAPPPFEPKWASPDEQEMVPIGNAEALRVATETLNEVDQEAKTKFREMLCKHLLTKAINLLKYKEMQKRKARELFYDKVTADSHVQIGRIFKALDADGNGYLDAEELRDKVAEYMGIEGKDFDADAFFKFYDVHGTPDGKINQKELRWYLADWADVFSEKEGDIAATKLALADVIEDWKRICRIRR